MISMLDYRQCANII